MSQVDRRFCVCANGWFSCPNVTPCTGCTPFMMQTFTEKMCILHTDLSASTSHEQTPVSLIFSSPPLCCVPAPRFSNTNDGRSGHLQPVLPVRPSTRRLQDHMHVSGTTVHV